jgi:hypothetical protein
MHSESSVDHFLQRVIQRAFTGQLLAGESRFRHTISAERSLARPKSKLFTFHQEEAVARRSETTPIRTGEAPQRRAQGLHKTTIYNILTKAGQTGQLAKNGTDPYRVGY